MILTEELAETLLGRSPSIVLVDMPSPALVVEVVSPETVHEERDIDQSLEQQGCKAFDQPLHLPPQSDPLIHPKMLAVSVFRGVCEPLSPPYYEINQSKVKRSTC